MEKRSWFSCPPLSVQGWIYFPDVLGMFPAIRAGGGRQVVAEVEVGIADITEGLAPLKVMIICAPKSLPRTLENFAIKTSPDQASSSVQCCH